MTKGVLYNIKTIKERLQKNYSSYQLLSTLDNYLFRAAKPIIETTNWLDFTVANVVGWNAMNPRRKISTLDRDVWHRYQFAFLVSDDPVLKYQILRKMRLERNILFTALDRFMSVLPNDPSQIRNPKALVSVGCFNPDELWAAVQECRFWYGLAVSMKGMIIEKYMRLVFVEAVNFHNYQRQLNPALTYDLEEIAQNFIANVAKAIDKCDTHHGTLTTYIRNWLQDAKSNPRTRGEYGVAYAIPPSKRKAVAMKEDDTVNIALSMDAESVQLAEAAETAESNLVRNQGLQLTRQLAKEVDPAGIGRLFLGIQEILTPEEKALLSLSIKRN